MKKLLDSWLSIWLYVLALIGLALLGLLIANWELMDWTSRLIWLSVIILPAHAWEEWRLPGGLHFAYNAILHRSDRPDFYPMNRLSDMATIFPAMLFGIGLLAVFPGHPVVAIGMFLFCTIEVVMHTFAGFLALNWFRSAGKRTIYNPGLGTSYAMFLPVSIGFLYLFITGGEPVTGTDWLAGVGGMLGVVGSCVVLPELLFKSRTTAFPFISRMYWSKYAGEADLH